MPGNEVGDRIHNFFGQENLSEGQPHSQVIEGQWPGLSNNSWAGSQRQLGTPLVSNLKNQNVQQAADFERGYGGQPSSMQHGINFFQSSLRPEFARGQFQNQQPNANGYMHGHQIFQTRQNETNFLGVDTESDQHNLTSRGFSVVDTQLGNGPELHKKNSVRMDVTESPVNYDFFGGQQQVSGQHPGTLQPLSRQQSGVSDMQLLQQQAMLKQMQEIQRQQQLQKQQFQQQEGRQLNYGNQFSSFAKQAAGGHYPALINGIPIHDASNYSWQSELMAANANWSQQGASPVMQASSSGLTVSPEQSQMLRSMGMVPQQVDQSLYGVPISGTGVHANQFASIQVDKPAAPHASGGNNSSSDNQFIGFPNQVSMQNVALLSRQNNQGKNMSGTSDGQVLKSRFSSENLQQINAQQRDRHGSDFNGKQELAGLSEISQEKTSLQVVASQNVATLDPTEEKILFGSDDSMWDAFGRGANSSSGGYNVPDGSDLFSGFTSVQSGTWSALMQSAVAETSRGDIGLQEEWSGLTFRNGEPATTNQQFVANADNAKQQSNWVDTNLQNMRPHPHVDVSNTGNNQNNIMGIKKSRVGTSHEKSGGLHVGPPKFIQQMPGEGTKWLDRSSLQISVAEGSHSYGKVAHSADVESNEKGISGSLTFTRSSRHYDRPNGWNFIDSSQPSAGDTSKKQGSENSLRAPQSNDQNSMFDVMGYGAGRWKNDSVSDSTVAVEHATSASGSPQVSREDTNLNNFAGPPESSPVRAGNESSRQQLQKRSNIDLWKSVDSSLSHKGNEIPGKNQPRNFHAFDVSGNDRMGNCTAEAQELQKRQMCKTKGNTFDAFQNLSHHTSSAGVKENALPDGSDLRDLHGGKQKSTGHTGRKPSGIRKFQYHPMGDVDVDVEPSYSAKNLRHLQSKMHQFSQGQKGQDECQIGQSKIPGHMIRNSLETEKVHFSGFPGGNKGIEDVPSKRMLPGSSPSTSANFDRAVRNNVTNKTGSSSQNMLELLQKVDQSREHGNATDLGTPEQNWSSEMHEPETSDGSVNLHQNQSSASRGFGLQLAPPSQPMPAPDPSFSSHSPSQTVNSLGPTHIASDIGAKNRTFSALASSVQSLPPSHEVSRGELRNNSVVMCQSGNNAQGNGPVPFSHGFPYSGSRLPNQLLTGQPTNSQSVNTSSNGFPSQPKLMNKSFERIQTSPTARSTPQNSVVSSSEMPHLISNSQNHARDSDQQFPVLDSAPTPQHHIASGTSQEVAFSKTSASVWKSVSTQQHSFGYQPFKTPSHMFKSSLQSNNNSETISSEERKLEEQNAHGFVNKEQSAEGEHQQQVSPDSDLAQKIFTASQSNESAANNLGSSSVSNFTSTQKEIEAFGRSLRPNINLHQNYSLQHQVQGMKNEDVDPGNRSLKRFKGPGGAMNAQRGAPQGAQQIHRYNNNAGDAAPTHPSAPPGDAKVLSFSSRPPDDWDRNAPSQDMLAYNSNNSQNFANNNNSGLVSGTSAQICPQMAPSWFNQYGKFRNGQILPTFDAQKRTSMTATELPFTAGRPAASADICQQESFQKHPIPSSLTSTNISSPPLLCTGAADANVLGVRSKKRKTATSELVPLYKELKHGQGMLWSISSTEVDWSKTANRLAEKLEDEMAEEVLPRSKRRLILTTQLMQLLLRPPLVSVLSADAFSHYESVAYATVRSMLGDACSTLSSAGTCPRLPSSSDNFVGEKLNASERINSQYFVKVTEDLIDRAKSLENDILRLDKRASLVDMRVECQELEKFSVINRFAKFHGRGQVDGAETTSSSSTDASVTAQKPRPQRYVRAFPMPKNIPDRVQGSILWSPNQREMK